ncbi:MAG TPA: hypothetical protein VF503_09330, partial [Sphingobium sp.]
MFRIDHTTAASALPAPEVAGTPGYFSEGDVIAGQPATIVTGDWLNMVQEELVALVLAGGGIPNKSNRSQVRDALLTIFAAKTGATFTGNVTVQGTGSATLGPNGDIVISRAGGTTGVLFFGLGGNRFLNFDGTNYVLAGAELYCGPGNALAWNAGNDGAGSGLDAGLFAGQLPSYYTDITSRLGYAPANKAGDTFSGAVSVAAGNSVMLAQSALYGGAGIFAGDSTRTGYVKFIRPNGVSNGYIGYADTSSGQILYLNDLGLGHNFIGGIIRRDGAIVWDATSDGAGSGLDADVLRGKTPAQVVAGEFTLTVNTNGQCEQRAGGGMTQGNII